MPMKVTKGTQIIDVEIVTLDDVITKGGNPAVKMSHQANAASRAADAATKKVHSRRAGMGGSISNNEASALHTKAAQLHTAALNAHVKAGTQYGKTAGMHSYHAQRHTGAATSHSATAARQGSGNPGLSIKKAGPSLFIKGVAPTTVAPSSSPQSVGVETTTPTGQKQTQSVRVPEALMPKKTSSPAPYLTATPGRSTNVKYDQPDSRDMPKPVKNASPAPSTAKMPGSTPTAPKPPMLASKSFTLVKSDKVGSGYGSFQRKEAHGTYHIESMPGQHTLSYTPKTQTKGHSLGMHRTLDAAASAAAKHHSTIGSAKKSESETHQGETMKDELENLFKSEIGASDNEEPIADCPHCEHPLTKSELLKSAKGRPKGGTVHGNQEGETHRGPKSGRNKSTPTRSVGKVPKVDNAKHITKSDDDEVVTENDGSSEDEDTTTEETVEKSEGKCAKCKSIVKAGTMCKCGHMMKSEAAPQGPHTPHHLPGNGIISWQNTGEDARIAAMIETGEIATSGRMSVPMDKNNAPRR